MDIINTLLIIIFFINIILSTFLFVNRKRESGTGAFSIASYATTLWIVSMFLFRYTKDINILIIPTKSLYVAGILISLFFLFFSFSFLSEKNEIEKRKKIYYVFGIFTLLIIVLIIFSNLIISKVTIIDGAKIVSFGPVYMVYGLFLIFHFIWTYSIFFNKRKNTKKIIEKRQLLYIILGTGTSVIFGLVYDIIVPYFGWFKFYWLGPVMTIIFITFTVYAIFKHQLFNTKAIIVELLTFILWIFLLIRTLISETFQDQVINGGLLIITIVLGVLLIRSVIKEIKNRERIEYLAKNLEKINVKLENANVKLKELDRQKSEFLSIASHQFRSPLSAIKGYASLIMEGSYGQIDEKIKQPVKNMFDSTNNLAMIVEDFLNVSRIEQGRMEYKFESVKINELIEKVVDEMKPSINDSCLEFSFTYDKNQQFEANVDISKFKQVITNLIDNALKYTKYGWIKAELKNTAGGKILFKLSDSGVGIPEKELSGLFTLFRRANNANKVNVKGTGLGLYIVKKIMEAHGGRVWAESDGEGKGAEFYVELNLNIPVKNLNPNVSEKHSDS